MGGLKFDGKNEIVINNKYRIWVTCNWKSLSAYHRHQPRAQTQRKTGGQFSQTSTVCYVWGEGYYSAAGSQDTATTRPGCFGRAKPDVTSFVYIVAALAFLVTEFVAAEAARGKEWLT